MKVTNCSAEMNPVWSVSNDLKRTRNWSSSSFSTASVIDTDRLRRSSLTEEKSNKKMRCDGFPQETITGMGAVCIKSWYPKFNGSHFGLPPSSIHKMTGLGGKWCERLHKRTAPIETCHKLWELIHRSYNVMLKLGCSVTKRRLCTNWWQLRFFVWTSVLCCTLQQTAETIWRIN